MRGGRRNKSERWALYIGEIRHEGDGIELCVH